MPSGAAAPPATLDEALARIEKLERERERLRGELARARRALKEHEARLARLGEAEAVGRLAGSVAHSFNNLLTALGCDAELALSRLPPGDPVRQHVAAVGRSIELGGALVRQLLSFGRERQRRQRTVRVAELLTDLEDLLRRLLGEQIRLTIEAAPDLPPVALPQFEQVLLTLLANARDAMPQGGRLLIRAVRAREATGAAGAGGPEGPKSETEMVELTVADTGAGMDAEVQEQAFHPLFTTKEESDAGLDLAWVRGVVEAAGGAIEVDSRPGQGTSFRLLLPAEREGEPERKQGRAGHAAAVTARTAGAETLLLVEDEENVRRPMVEILEDRGYVVLAAADGAEAARLAERYRGPIHLLVTDLVLPGLSGRELAALLGQRRPETRVLYTTGYPDDLVAEASDKGRGPRLLRKPFTGQALVETVRRLLDQG